jgi:peptide deformylase
MTRCVSGAGLAAIQIGVPMRLFIIDGAVAGGDEGAPPKVFINPEIVEISPESQTGDEGCLSFPQIFVPVKRGMKARVRAMGLDGETFEAEGEGLFARALQHETDHLNGRLLIDQVGPVKREIIKRKLRKDLEAEREEAQSGKSGGAASAG